jgi:hypothetical protein
MIKRKKKIKKYQRREPKYDFLKYWRIIRYDLSTADLEMLLYLYTQGIFTYYEFAEYGNFFGWDRKRFKRLKENGWIHCWQNKRNGEYRLYEITRHGRHVCTNMYKMLNGDMLIPETSQNNPVMRKKRFSEKILALGIKRFNEEVKESRGEIRVEY